MSNLESSSLAGSAPSEQEIAEMVTALIEYADSEVTVRREMAKASGWASDTNGLIGRRAKWMRWLASALPGLLATARDGERMAALDEALDDFHWRHVRPTGGGTETVAVLDWFFGDGDSSTTTSGATIREAVDAFLELMAANQREEAAAARSTGSVDNG